MSTSFEQFIRGLLKRASLQEETINQIWATPKYVEMFETAFVHKSYDSNAKRNYEKVENLGDLVLNMAIVNYVVRTHFDVLSADWLANIKHRMISGVKFATAATRLGFFEHIKYGDGSVRIGKEFKNYKEEFEREMKNSDDLIRDSELYRGMLEDVFEAFSGTLQIVINDMSGLEAGPGYAVCYELIKSLIENELGGISLDVKDVFDPITIVKEIYDSKKWPPKAADEILIRKLPNNKFQVTYYVFEKFLKNNSSNRQIHFGTGQAGTLIAAKRAAALETLKVLKNRYRIQHATKKMV